MTPNKMKDSTMNDWKQYKRKGLSEMRPYIAGEDVSHVSISEPDKQNGSPREGDMIARNPKSHADQWLVAKKYFEDNLEPAATAPCNQQPEGGSDVRYSELLACIRGRLKQHRDNLALWKEGVLRLTGEDDEEQCAVMHDLCVAIAELDTVLMKSNLN